MPTDDEFSTWTTEELIDFEQRLYDDEVAGESTWDIRERVLLELNWRELVAHGQSSI